jgi:hypothetical protein
VDASPAQVQEMVAELARHCSVAHAQAGGRYNLRPNQMQCHLLLGQVREAFDCMGRAVAGGQAAIDEYIHAQGLAARRRSAGPGLSAGVPPKLTSNAGPTALGRSDPYGATRYYQVQREDGLWVRALDGRLRDNKWKFYATNGFTRRFPHQSGDDIGSEEEALEYIKWLSSLELVELLSACA